MTRPMNLFRIAMVGAALALPANFATAAVAQGDFAGTSKMEIATQLERQGYRVREIETEYDLFEAFADLDGKTYEIYVDAKSGKVLKIKLDD